MVKTGRLTQIPPFWFVVQSMYQEEVFMQRAKREGQPAIRNTIEVLHDVVIAWPGITVLWKHLLCSLS